MPPINAEDLRNITDFPSLVKYLRDTLKWHLEAEDIDDLTFDYEPKELGLESQYAVKLRSIKQLRPLSDRQPFGVFYLEFEPKRLPVVVLRRILRALVPKKRQTAADSTRAVWNKNDLLFISQIGEGAARRISFAHFKGSGDALPVLHTFDWDASETNFQLISPSLEKLKWPDDDRDVEEWRSAWTGAFPKPHEYGIATAEKMSVELARLARDIRDAVKEIYRYESANGSLHTLCTAFQKVLVHDLTPDGFADTIAQTIAYGLFAAKVELDLGKLLGVTNLADMIPATNPFLRELFREIEKLSGEEKGYINFDELGVSALVDTLNKADMGLVLADFGRQTGEGREDPVIYFYEHFLKEYDKKEKVKRGEFYTPKSVVSYIVRSVDILLREKFDLADGLADTATWGEMAARNKDIAIPKGVSPNAPFVQILDPATGTGTFLETVIEVVHETLTHKWNAQRLTQEQRRAAWNEYVPKHLLPRLNAFELKMAPYAIAHVKLGLKLKQLGYDFQSNERLRVFLTNTLEPPTQGDKQLTFLPEFLSQESFEADAVKRDTPITVVIGNPPYSSVSANMGKTQREIVEPYRYLDGVKIKERGALQLEKNLQDDYVKFIRYAEQRASQVGMSIIGLITNHAYLTNPTLRGMRYSLVKNSSEIWIVDLHGNSKRKEVSPVGTGDKNVFDIQQGVAISVFLFQPNCHLTEVYHSELWGDREVKYDILAQSNHTDLPTNRILPTSPTICWCREIWSC